jgi:hypothetical protein
MISQPISSIILSVISWESGIIWHRDRSTLTYKIIYKDTSTLTEVKGFYIKPGLGQSHKFLTSAAALPSAPFLQTHDSLTTCSALLYPVSKLPCLVKGKRGAASTHPESVRLPVSRGPEEAWRRDGGAMLCPAHGNGHWNHTNIC